jgi:hypothetical protein
MATPLSRITTRLAYGARQLPRVAWYVGHGLVMKRLSESVRKEEGEGIQPRAHTDVPVPDLPAHLKFAGADVVTDEADVIVVAGLAAISHLDPMRRGGSAGPVPVRVRTRERGVP